MLLWNSLSIVAERESFCFNIDKAKLFTFKRARKFDFTRLSYDLTNWHCNYWHSNWKADFSGFRHSHLRCLIGLERFRRIKFAGMIEWIRETSNILSEAIYRRAIILHNILTAPLMRSILLYNILICT